MKIRTEEDHAKIVLESDLGIEFKHHDDGSKDGMPDLLSVDKKHVAEVITTAPPAVREAQKSLKPMPEPTLPHCVRVIVPYTSVGAASKAARNKTKADILQWTANNGCEYHWSSHDEWRLRPGIDPMPILVLGEYRGGVKVLCVQSCQHSANESHRIEWSVVHEPSSRDPWELIRQSLHIVDTEQRGGVQALAEKLTGYPHKHLVMYPFGPPGNLTAALSRYVSPSNSLDLMPPQLNPPLSDIHIWLLYRYETGYDIEGIHVCNGHWEKFGTAFPKHGGLPSLVRGFHYRDS